MRGGTATTFSVLCKTNNEAANSVLVAALDASNHNVQTAAVRALAKRRSPAASRELLRRWHTFSDRLKSVVGANSSRIAGAVRDAVLSQENRLTANGCDAIIRFEEFDLLPALVTAAEDKSNPQADKAAETLLYLSEMLYDELVSPRDYRDRRNPKLIRDSVLGSLEDAVGRFEAHQCLEILEAFLLLAGHDNRLLKRILRNLSDKAYLSVANLMTNSPRPGIIRLLLSYLEDRTAPNTVHSILARRKDVPFVRAFLQTVTVESTGTKCANLRKIEAFNWLRGSFELVGALNSEEQRGLVHLVMESGMSRLKAFEVVKFVLLNGGDEGRRAASSVLDSFNGADANSLILAALADDDPVVQANVVHCLRERGIPGAMHRLIELVESPHKKVREAARASLDEFSFDSFLSAYDTLEANVKRSTGPIVRRVDPKAIARLRAEFRTPSRSRKQRAIAMAISMGCVRDVEACLVGLTRDDDQSLRAEAARALAHSDSPASRNALRALLLDRSSAVKETAEQTLQSFASTSAPRLDGETPIEMWEGQL